MSKLTSSTYKINGNYDNEFKGLIKNYIFNIGNEAEFKKKYKLNKMGEFRYGQYWLIEIKIPFEWQ